jgi:hypothetical protein
MKMVGYDTAIKLTFEVNNFGSRVKIINLKKQKNKIEN